MRSRHFGQCLHGEHRQLPLIRFMHPFFPAVFLRGIQFRVFGDSPSPKTSSRLLASIQRRHVPLGDRHGVSFRIVMRLREGRGVPEPIRTESKPGTNSEHTILRFAFDFSLNQKVAPKKTHPSANSSNKLNARNGNVPGKRAPNHKWVSKTRFYVNPSAKSCKKILLPKLLA